MWEFVKYFLLAVAVVILFMFLVQLFARWKAKRLEGKDLKEFGRNVILYFYSPSCGACRRMEPEVEALSKKAKVKKIDVSNVEGLNLARKLGILGTPTTVVVKNGKVAKVFMGIQKAEKILQEVKG